MQQAVEFFKDSRKLLVFLLFICLISISLSAMFGMVVTVVMVCSLIVFGAIYIIYNEPVHGLTIILASVFLLPFFLKVFRLYSIPITTLIELFNFLLMLILIVKGKFSGLKSLPGILVFLWIGLQIAEVFNPNAHSRIAGFFAMRTVLTFALAFFNTYSAINSKQDIYKFLNGWIVLGLLAALYGMYQEYFGLPSYDYAWATVDEFRYKLLFTWGRLRKFSFFTSSSEFGLVMVYSGLASLVLALLPNQKIEKQVLYIVLAIIMITSMMYSGSRTAMVLLVAGVAIFAAITLWRKVLLMVLGVAFLGAVFVFKPTSNKSLKVMFTAFEGSEDASMNVRLLNQKMIREYIKRAPLGFGVGSTGYYGAKYSPDTFIGSFPPDSELVKIAIETGWVGLFFWCILLILIFVYGLNAYFKARDRELKFLMVIPLVEFFTMILGQYPQECFRAPVLATLFAFTAGMIAKLKELDR